VEAIRREAGGNTFEVLHRADDETFSAAVGDAATLLGQSKGIVGGYRESKIHIPKDEDIKVVIERLNDKCDLRSINEIIPSINDIFIRAVNGTL
jgi:ABC-2 type transport system ATP-binding protein